MVRSLPHTFVAVPVVEHPPGSGTPKGEIILQYTRPNNPRPGVQFEHIARIANTGNKEGEFSVMVTFPNGLKSFRTGIHLKPDEYTDHGTGGIIISRPGTYNIKSEAYLGGRIVGGKFEGGELTDSKTLAVRVL